MTLAKTNGFNFHIKNSLIESMGISGDLAGL